MAVLSAMLSVPSAFVRPREQRVDADAAHARFTSSFGDHMTLLNVFYAFTAAKEDPGWCWESYLNARALKQAVSVHRQLINTLTRLNLPVIDADRASPSYSTRIRRAILAGYFQQVAHLQTNGSYRTLKDHQEVALHPSSSLRAKPEWVRLRQR